MRVRRSCGECPRRPPDIYNGVGSKGVASECVGNVEYRGEKRRKVRMGM